MIISHKYKFIFIKPEKTAGSSLEIALSKYCDHNDIITTIGEEYIRKKSVSDFKPVSNFRRI